MVTAECLDKFLNAAREVARLRWPVPKPALGLPVQRPIGKRNGADILWPASNAALESLDLVELNGVTFHIGSVAQYITSSLESETQALISIARNLDWQSERIRQTERQSLEILEREATAAMLAGYDNPAYLPECLAPLAPVAIRIHACHRKVPVASVYRLIELVTRREIYPASASVKAEITAVDIEVRFWQNFRFGWLALRCSILHKQTDIYLVYINENGKEYALDTSGAVARMLVDIAYTPDEAVSLLNRLNFLITFFGRGSE